MTLSYEEYRSHLKKFTIGRTKIQGASISDKTLKTEDIPKLKMALEEAEEASQAAEEKQYTNDSGVEPDLGFKVFYKEKSFWCIIPGWSLSISIIIFYMSHTISSDFQFFFTLLAPLLILILIYNSYIFRSSIIFRKLRMANWVDISHIYVVFLLIHLFIFFLSHYISANYKQGGIAEFLADNGKIGFLYLKTV